MSELEKTKQQVEEIKRQAEEQKLAKEERKRREEEKKRREAEKAETLKQARERGLLVVKEQTPKLLQKINAEFFSEEGVVTGWERTSSEVHSHWEHNPYGEDDFYIPHTTEQLEIRLKIPGFGDIITFVPLVDRVGHKYWKHYGKATEKEVIEWGDPRSCLEYGAIVIMTTTPKEYQSLCYKKCHTNRPYDPKWKPPKEVLLELPEDELIKQLKESILYQVVELHEKALEV